MSSNLNIRFPCYTEIIDISTSLTSFEEHIDCVLRLSHQCYYVQRGNSRVFALRVHPLPLD